MHAALAAWLPCQQEFDLYHENFSNVGTQAAVRLRGSASSMQSSL